MNEYTQVGNTNYVYDADGNLVAQTDPGGTTAYTENGVALLWSGFESDAFAARAKSAGFTVTCEPIRRMRADLSHFIYVLAKNPGAGHSSCVNIKN